MARLMRTLTLIAVLAALALSAALPMRAASPPANDDFAAAIPLDVAALPPDQLVVDVSGATFEPGERLPCAPAGTTARTVWYAFTYPATATGVVDIEATGAKVTAFFLPSGSGVGDLSAGLCWNSSSLLVPWNAGRTVFVQLAADLEASSISVRFAWVARPANDDLANARWLSVGDVAEVDTRASTVERDGIYAKPYEAVSATCSRVFSRSTWYVFYAPHGGRVVIDPTGSSFTDMTLQVFAGDPRFGTSFGCAARTPLAFTAEAGRAYWVQATDAGSGGGLLHLASSFVVDTDPPVLTLPAEVVVEATDPGGATVYFAASAYDAVDGVVPIHCWQPSGTYFRFGVSHVVCWAVDASGNEAGRSFVVAVIDSTPPVLSLPTVQVVEAEGPDGAIVALAVSAADAIDGPLPVACTPASGALLPIGDTSVWCSAFDHSANFAYGAFTVVVRDTVAPSVSYTSHPSTYALTDAVDIGCSAADAVGVTASTCSPITGAAWTFGLGPHRFDAEARDAAGNVGAASTSFSVAATYGSMIELTNLWVAKPGVAKDLVSLLSAAAAAEARGQYKAEAGALGEYAALVLSQAGKAVTPSRAELLVRFAQTL
jgi:hypothetical protein